MRRFRRIAAVFAGLIGWSVVDPAFGAFQIVDQSLTLNVSQKLAFFSITFDQVPDFQTQNPDGLPIHSFQYEIDGKWDGVSPGTNKDLTAIIRGDEIRFDGDLRVRDPFGFTPDPESGGWGPILGAVDFELNGNTVEFSAPWSLLRLNSAIFKYRVYSLEEGILQDFREERVVPLPMGVWMGLSGLVTVGLVEYARRRRAA